MRDKPILFSGPMVRAILEGRKSQTRRVLKPQPDAGLPICSADWVPGSEGAKLCYLNGFDGSPLGLVPTSYAPGDRLWVRETWVAVEPNIAPPEFPDGGLYRASWPYEPECKPVWKPSIHMPRWASRLTLVVSDVRVQRLRDISEEDARAEGVDRPILPHWPDRPYVSAFRGLWNDLNAKRGDGWDQNPWVIAITFEPHNVNIDRMDASHD